MYYTEEILIKCDKVYISCALAVALPHATLRPSICSLCSLLVCSTRLYLQNHPITMNLAAYWAWSIAKEIAGPKAKQGFSGSAETRRFKNHQI